MTDSAVELLAMSAGSEPSSPVFSSSCRTAADFRGAAAEADRALPGSRALSSGSSVRSPLSRKTLLRLWALVGWFQRARSSLTIVSTKSLL
eukprot:CAMPEP_0172718814 /NCGR_PEP_ID=MMETSP1074-20121228/75143_1 /TAXON_ID=2916 /ORGANISM="Ceratium fusus, Strain PA161109" /LENGTH=90 /DNA_ID=CAMNT_0013544089 /DNA_START=482 /DNA_END=755 /DNA_ORIENTATION=+